MSYFDDNDLNPESLGFIYTGKSAYGYTKYYLDKTTDMRLSYFQHAYQDNYSLSIFRNSTNELLVKDDDVVNHTELMMRLSELGHSSATQGLKPYYRNSKLSKILP